MLAVTSTQRHDGSAIDATPSFLVYALKPPVAFGFVVHAAAKIKLATAAREGNDHHGQARGISVGRIRRCLMDSACDVHADSDLVCLSVLLRLLEDAPVSGYRMSWSQGWRRAPSIIFQAPSSLADPAAEIDADVLEDTIKVRNGGTKLKDCIVNARVFKACVSDARVSVLFKLLENFFVQDMNKLEKEAAPHSSGSTNVTVDLKFQGEVLSRMPSHLSMYALTQGIGPLLYAARSPDIFFETLFRDSGPRL